MRDINEHTPGEDLIIKTAVRLMVPFAQLFGLYVIVHGHYSPGGGFQGGVILGAAFIMLALAFDLQTSQQYMTVRVNTWFSNKEGICIIIINFVIIMTTGPIIMLYSTYTTDSQDNWEGYVNRTVR